MTRAALLAIPVVLTLAGCAPQARTWPEIPADAWTRHRSAAAGWSLDYPGRFQVTERGSSAMFRDGRTPRFFVTVADPEEAKHRGLWAAHDPVADVRLAGVAGKKYVYDHYDGPSGDHTISYVIPWNGKYLALELRTAGSEPTPAQQRILDSLTL